MIGRVFGVCFLLNNILVMFGEEFECVKFFFGVDGFFFSLVIDNCLGGRFIDLVYNFKYRVF